MKNILLLVHDDCGQEARLQAALDVTRAVEGHLTCLDVAEFRTFPGDGFGSDAGIMLLEAERVQESANRERLQARLAAEDVAWSWIDTSGSFEACLENAARLADLIVINRQLDKYPAPDMLGVAASLIVRSGRPILAVPDSLARFDLTGAALLAWDGSDAAAAALASAVPLLRFAGSVTIVEVEDKSVTLPAEEAATYLSRHGVHATIVRAHGKPARTLLGAANGGRFAWLVMGGFGHGRLREMLLGGVTRSLLGASAIPLFLAR